MTRRVYLSGPMTGIDNYNYPLFNEVAESLTSQGVIVWNPAENPLLEECSLSYRRRRYLRNDSDGLAWASEIVLLPGYEESEGVFWELAVAKWLDLDVSLCVRVGNTWKLEPITFPPNPWTCTTLGVIL